MAPGLLGWGFPADLFLPILIKSSQLYGVGIFKRALRLAFIPFWHHTIKTKPTGRRLLQKQKGLPPRARSAPGCRRRKSEARRNEKGLLSRSGGFCLRRQGPAGGMPAKADAAVSADSGRAAFAGRAFGTGVLKKLRPGLPPGSPADRIRAFETKSSGRRVGACGERRGEG